MAHDVFITHSSKDRQTAVEICRILEDNGIRCWYAPRNIQSGANWTASIIAGLNSSRIMILVWSGNSNSSAHVSREVHHAFNKGISVIPFRIEDVAPTDELEYYLESVQWLDAFTPPLEDNVMRLVDHIRTIIGWPTAASESAPGNTESTETLSRELAAEQARVLAAEAELAREKRVEEEHRRRIEPEATRRQAEEQERLRLESDKKRAPAEAPRTTDAVERTGDTKGFVNEHDPSSSMGKNAPAVIVSNAQLPPSPTRSGARGVDSSSDVVSALSPIDSHAGLKPATIFPVWRVVIGAAALMVAGLVVWSAFRSAPGDHLASSNIPTPPASVEPSVEPTASPSDSPQARPTPSTKPTPGARPTPSSNENNSSTPRPRPTPGAPISGGILNHKAVHLVIPPYPELARSSHASGEVPVQVLIDETGRVIRAHATHGHVMLLDAAEAAARASTFNPTTISGQPVKVSGVIIYNFVAH